MLVLLFGAGKMHKIILPKVPFGTYIINDGEDKKLVEIIAKNNQWQIISNQTTKVMPPKNTNISNSKDVFIKEIILKEYEMYRLIIGELQTIPYTLYCMPVYEENWTYLSLNNIKEISIGSDKSNEIIYENNYVANKHAVIFFNNGRWILENRDRRYGVLLNDDLIYNKSAVLSNGDIIFIMGLKIILMGNNIYINNPKEKMHYNEQILVKAEVKEQQRIEKEEDNVYKELYKPSDYFYRAPRILNKINEEKIVIAPPPSKEKNDHMPEILTISSTLCMGIMSLTSFISTILGIINGSMSFKDSILSLISSVAMLFCMLLIPIMTTKWEKKRAKEYEEKRQKRYSEYISKMKIKINKIKDQKRKMMFERYATTEECTRIILNRDKRLWERTINDSDFLTINLGSGNIPFNIEISYPEKEEFSMEEEDNLKEMLNDFTKEIETLENSVVTVSLSKQKIMAYVDNNEENINKFMQNLFIQLMAFQSYHDLKFVFLLNKDNTRRWDYVKMFPYVWDDSKEFRFFEDDINNMDEISKYLENEFERRKSTDENISTEKSPYYLIITDDYRKIENLSIIGKILKENENLGFSIFCIANNINQLPNECKKFISIRGIEGRIFSSERMPENEIIFTFNNLNTFFFEKIEKTISNIPIKYKLTEKNALPSYYTFLEMYNVGLIDQLNILDRWKNNDSTISLAAPIGINGAGKLINLDIHEKFHGPHGLIAGSTGSGKSEFIITYILSLALNYHPDDINFVLIDYKGGGLAGAFQKQNVKLPHLAGTITNIDKEGLQRSLVSIKSEMTKRQIKFNEVREMTNGGVIDIYKYQKLYHSGVVEKPMPHLIIICDEFAELKQQQPDFMDELVSVSRIGRSLGVHLILATQKPSGIVDEQIRSNSKFAICLKVQDKSDSSDVIERVDAAYLKQAGRFYIKVGNDEYFDLGQSGWSGAKYYPSDDAKTEDDDSIKFISNTGSIIKEVNEYTKKTVDSQGDQLTNIVQQMYDIAKREKIETQKLWLDDIPEKIYIKEVKNKYKYIKKANSRTVVIGEYDDPENQKQGIVSLDLIKNGNIAIFGNANSGKETLLNTFIYDLITTYTTEEVWMYILDFGTESLKIFKDAPHVGEIMFVNDGEKLNRFFSRIQEIVKERKRILADYNGDYKFFLKTSGKAMPLITIFINGYETFTENYEDLYDDTMLTLTREGIKTGIVFVIVTTASSDLRYRMAQNFKQKIALSLNEGSGYNDIFEGIGKKKPAQRFGRGLINLEEKVYDFQTAKSCEPEEYNVFIKETVERAKKENKIEAEKIPILPEVVKMDDFEINIEDVSNVPIGLRKKDLKAELYDFKNNYISVIAAKDIEEAMQFASNICKEIKDIKDIDTIILDPDRKILSSRNEIQENYKKLMRKSNTRDLNHTICFIFGLDKFVNYMEELARKNKEETDDDDDDDYDDVGGIEQFEKIVNNKEKSHNFSFIIVDSASKIKEHNYDDWYKSNVTGDNVIWVGNGIDDQYLLDVNVSRKYIINNCGCSFGYINKKDQTIMLKLLEMKEKRNEDE